MDKRYILDSDDKEILDAAKKSLTKTIELLKQRNLRHANIEIELGQHIKTELRKGEH